MAIFQLNNGIRIAGNDPIDYDRYIAPDISTRDLLVTNVRAYNGLLVYVTDVSSLYILEDVTINKWKLIGDSSSFIEYIDDSLFSRDASIIQLRSDISDVSIRVSIVDASIIFIKGEYIRSASTGSTIKWDGSYFDVSNGLYVKEVSLGSQFVWDASGNLTVDVSSMSASVKYDTSLNPLLTMPYAVGGIPADTSVGALYGDTFISLFDQLLFPTVEAYIGTAKSASLTGVTGTIVEVGTAYAPATNAAYNPGQITNGDGTPDSSVTGNANEYVFKLPDATTDQTYTVAANSQAHTFSSYNVLIGNNTWTVDISYDAGNGIYRDNKQIIGSNLAADQVAGTITPASGTIIARRYYFWGIGAQGAHPTNSAGVRALANTAALSATYTGTFALEILANVKGVWFYIPDGKTVTVIHRESFNNVTADFTSTTFNVQGANGEAGIIYKSYITTIGGTGFSSTQHYDVTIT